MANINRIIETVRELRRTGKVSEAESLNRAFHERKEITDDDLNVLLGLAIKPDAPNAPTVGLPPRQGKGSSKKRWIEVALALSSLEPEVAESMSRDDIVDYLVTEGIIPAE